MERIILIDGSAGLYGLSRMMTYDDASQIVGSVGVFVSEKIGPKRNFTPEGYLYCQDVRIARTGEQLYGPNETPIKVGDAGYLIVQRDEAEVFRPEFLASFEGKPVTNNHPRTRDGVHAANWKDHVVGVTINPRRGEGADKDFIVADLLIMDAAAIRDVMEGKREVSAGYAAEYDEISKGRARQKNMLGNHVALVDAARCGPSCSISDSAAQHLGEDMRQHTNDHASALDPKHPLVVLWQAVRDALKSKDEKAIEAAVNAAMPTPKLVADCSMARDEEAHTRLQAIEDRLGAFDEYMKKNPVKDAATVAADAAQAAAQAAATSATDAARQAGDALAFEAPEGQADKARVATDSALLHDAFQEAVAGAEILVPGITLPKYTKDAKPAETLLDILKLRRSALELAYSLPGARVAMDQMNGGKKPAFDQMTQSENRQLFRSSVVARKNALAVEQRVNEQRRDQRTTDKKTPVRSLSDYNKRLEAHYHGQKAAS